MTTIHFGHMLLAFSAGLIHIAIGSPGAALPGDLANIKFTLAFVEVNDEIAGVHAIVNRIFGSDRDDLKKKLWVSHLRQGNFKIIPLMTLWWSWPDKLEMCALLRKKFGQLLRATWWRIASCCVYRARFLLFFLVQMGCDVTCHTLYICFFVFPFRTGTSCSNSWTLSS